MDLLTDDKKLINLMTVFGNPFPRANASNEDMWPLGDIEKEDREGRPDENSGDQADEVACVSYAHLEREGKKRGSAEGGTRLSVMDGSSEQQVHNDIQVFIELHEGQETNSSPFSIHPKQMVHLRL